jgi:hypothetical protein
MTTAKEKRWQAAYQKADTLYTARDCGCLVLVLVDMPDVIRSTRDEILRESLAGRALRRVGVGELPPLHCAQHERESA